MTPETRKTAIRLPDQLVLAARVRALKERRSMRQIVETALRQYLTAKRRRQEDGNDES